MTKTLYLLAFAALITSGAFAAQAYAASPAVSTTAAPQATLNSQSKPILVTLVTATTTTATSTIQTSSSSSTPNVEVFKFALSAANNHNYLALQNLPLVITTGPTNNNPIKSIQLIEGFTPMQTKMLGKNMFANSNTATIDFDKLGETLPIGQTQIFTITVDTNPIGGGDGTAPNDSWIQIQIPDQTIKVIKINDNHVMPTTGSAMSNVISFSSAN